jgi:hypothetical protein
MTARPIPIRGERGRLRGSIGAGRDAVPAASSPRLPAERSRARIAAADTVRLLAASAAAAGLVAAGPAGAAHAAPAPHADASASGHSATVVKVTKAQKCANATARLRTLKAAVAVAARRMNAGTGTASQVRRSRVAVSRQRTQVAKACGVNPSTAIPPAPATPAHGRPGAGSSGSTPGVPTAVTSVAPNGSILATSPQTAARTAADAHALLQALPWTLKGEAADSFDATATSTGRIPTPERVAAWDSGFHGYVESMYSPVPGTLVIHTVDPRNGYEMYVFASEYTGGWEFNVVQGPAGLAPLQLRTVPDADYPKGYRHEYMNGDGTWFEMNTPYGRPDAEGCTPDEACFGGSFASGA